MGQETISDNSLYHTDLSVKKALILVPHEDDEINIAGNLIPLLNQMKAAVYVAFLTNGDYEMPADMRMDEAARSLDVLGVPRKNIFFLGYPDTLNYASCGHVYRNESQPILTDQGKCEAYGGAGFTDYGYVRFGCHSKYLHRDMFRDVSTLLLDIVPDLVVCVDLDIHADHRALSLLLDEVLCDIFRRFPQKKRPVLLKRFAYSTAYNAVDDYDSSNLKETMCPPKTTGNESLVDASYYVWDERIRIPIPQENRVSFLSCYERTSIFEAMLCHDSQRMKLKAGRIINSDEVFFSRRTDSASYHARVYATSGNSAYINDFRLNNLIDIDSYGEKFEDYLWIPEEADKEKTLTMRWEKEIPIKAFRFWGNIEGNPIKKIAISFSDGSEYIAGPLPERGKGLMFVLPKTIQSDYCKVKLLETSYGSGLAELEVFSEQFSQRFLSPYIKILFYDNFVYAYNRKMSEKEIELGVYICADSHEVQWEVLQGNAEIRGNILMLKDDSVVSLKASLVAEEQIYDIVTVVPRSNIWFMKLYGFQKARKCRLVYERICWAVKKRYIKYARMKRNKGLLFMFSMMVKQVGRKICTTR